MRYDPYFVLFSVLALDTNLLVYGYIVSCFSDYQSRRT